MDKLRQTIFRFIKEWSLIPGRPCSYCLFRRCRFGGAFTFHGFESRKNGDRSCCNPCRSYVTGRRVCGRWYICARTMCKHMEFRFLVEVFRFRKLLRKTAVMCRRSVVKEDMHFSRKSCKNKAMMFLATAHHAEDQLETVLMQVTKGSQPSGMPVKREVDGGITHSTFPSGYESGPLFVCCRK